MTTRGAWCIHERGASLEDTLNALHLISPCTVARVTEERDKGLTLSFKNKYCGVSIGEGTQTSGLDIVCSDNPRTEHKRLTSRIQLNSPRK